MADNVSITPGSGNTIAADEVTDGTLGAVKVQYVKLMDATIDGTNKLIISGTGAAKVDGSAVTQPVSGTFFQATQPVSGTVTANQGGTWTVQPGNTANTTAWKVDGSAVTQPISAATLPLPSGASTSANQTTEITNLTNLVNNSNDVENDFSLTAVAQTAQISLDGHASIGLAVASVGTGGQLVVEGSIDNISWFSLDQYVETTETWQSNTITATGNFWSESIGALGYVRVRCTALTSGTMTGRLMGSAMAMGTFEFQQNEGTSLPFNAVYVAGKTNDGSPQFRPLPLGAAGRSVIVEGVAGGTAQPVSLTSTTITGTVAVTESGTWTVQPGNTANTTPWLVTSFPAALAVTATGAAAAAVTATLPAVAAQFHYITFIEITKIFTAANAASATPLVVTTTNIPGSYAISFGQPLGTIGTEFTKIYPIDVPIKSSVVNTATTIVCPATAGIIWRVNVQYFAAV